MTQGKEPLHFVRCFHGRMVIHSGGKASGFKNKGDEDSYDEDGVALYHVKGFGGADSTKAAQVAEVATSLNSGDCFVLLTPAAAFLWAGNGANETEKATAQAVCGVLKQGRKLQEVAEGGEPDAFWEALGGKGEHPLAARGLGRDASVTRP